MIKFGGVKYVTFKDIFVLFIMMTVSHVEIASHFPFFECTVTECTLLEIPSLLIMAYIWSSEQEEMSCFLYC